MQTVVCQSLGLIMVDDHVALKFANFAHELKLRKLRILRRLRRFRKNYAESCSSRPCCVVKVSDLSND